MFVTESYVNCLTLPVSITAVISSMVMDVSATLVDTMIFFFPGGGRAKTRFCSLEGRDACSGSTCSSLEMLSALMALMQRDISAIPAH